MDAKDQVLRNHDNSHAVDHEKARFKILLFFFYKISPWNANNITISPHTYMK